MFPELEMLGCFLAQFWQSHIKTEQLKSLIVLSLAPKNERLLISRPL